MVFAIENLTFSIGYNASLQWLYISVQILLFFSYDL